MWHGFGFVAQPVVLDGRLYKRSRRPHRDVTHSFMDNRFKASSSALWSSPFWFIGAKSYHGPVYTACLKGMIAGWENRVVWLEGQSKCDVLMTCFVWNQPMGDFKGSLQPLAANSKKRSSGWKRPQIGRTMMSRSSVHTEERTRSAIIYQGR